MVNNNMNVIYNIVNNLNFTNNVEKFGILKLYVNQTNQELVDLYRSHVQQHNTAILSDPFPNSGFDLFVPIDTAFMRENANQMINHEVKCEMTFCNRRKGHCSPSAYTMHPRSSISKTQLMLSNHTGIIDSGYRGNLIGAFRWLKTEADDIQYTVPKHTRLLQVCLPTLHPIFVVMVKDESELTGTSRGEGGFGSTGLGNILSNTMAGGGEQA